MPEDKKRIVLEPMPFDSRQAAPFMPKMREDFNVALDRVMSQLKSELATKSTKHDRHDRTIGPKDDDSKETQ